MKIAGLAIGILMVGSAIAQSSPPPARSGDRDGPPPSAEEGFKRRDTNKDGFLSKEEMKGSRIEAEFDKLDTNHDGKLSLDEYKTGRQAMGRGDRRADARDGDRPGPERDRDRSPPPSAQALFKDLDTNHDGKLSFEEFRAGIPKPPPHEPRPHHGDGPDDHVEPPPHA